MASRICWNCDKYVHLTIRGKPSREIGPVEASNEWFAFFTCDFCGFGSVGHCSLTSAEIEKIAGYRVTESSTSESVFSAVTRLMDHPRAPLSWQPERSLGREFDDVPKHINDAASEAFACYSIRSYRASILMARAVVEAVAKDKGVTNGRLVAKIDKLYDDEVISRSVKDVAHEIRYLGNDMAHGDFVDDIGEEEADDVLNFLESLLEEVYQRDARLNRRKSARQKTAP